MLQIREHIVNKVLVVFLTAVLVTPLFVKLNHLFEDHKHEVCETPNKTHFHEYEIECEFYNFTINTNFYQSLLTFDIPNIDQIDELIDSQYLFISDYQKLQFSLRGPPLSV